MKTSAKGIITKIRVLKLTPTLLVRFTIESNDINYNCIVARIDLANKVLMLPEGTVSVAAFGHFNNKKQLVIEKLAC